MDNDYIRNRATNIPGAMCLEEKVAQREKENVAMRAEGVRLRDAVADTERRMDLLFDMMHKYRREVRGITIP